MRIGLILSAAAVLVSGGLLGSSTGSTANEKAKNLLNMWNHLDPYNNNNSYTSTSKKEYRVAR